MKNKKKDSNMYSSDLLKQRQNYPLDIKIKMTERRIREWYNTNHGNVYISFSGGKDSTVLLHIVARASRCKNSDCVL